jgi:hypothetical protein
MPRRRFDGQKRLSRLLEDRNQSLALVFGERQPDLAITVPVTSE